MKSCINSSNKAENQMFETNIVTNCSPLETGCDMCLLRLSYKSAEKLFKED